MANHLAESKISPRPPFRSREQATMVHAYLGRLENHPGAAKSYISDQLAPTHEDRQRLIARQQELSSGLTPVGNIAEAGVILGQMFAGYLTVRLSEQQASEAVAAYLAQVKHLPLWAISAGCQSCIARNNPFPPSAGELRTACERAVQPVWDEGAEIRKVLDAEIYHSAPKAQRERITAGFQTLVAELRQTNSMQPKPKPRFTRPSFGTSTTLSEEAAAKFAAKYAGKPLTDDAEPNEKIKHKCHTCGAIYEEGATRPSQCKEYIVPLDCGYNISKDGVYNYPWDRPQSDAGLGASARLIEAACLLDKRADNPLTDETE